MVNILNFNLKHGEDYREEEYDLKIIVDTSVVGSKNLKEVNFTPDIVIDHHDDDPDPNSKLVLKAPVGSCSTLITLLFDYYNTFTENPSEMELEVSTSLMLGLKTDTKDFTSYMTSYDRIAFGILVNRQDTQKVTNIVNYPLPEELFKAKSFAYYNGNFYRSGSVAVAGTGYIKEEHKDFNAIISDELIRGEGIEKVIVIGIVDYKAITASVRTTQVTVDTKGFCHRIFGPNVSGGKKGNGGAWIPLSEDLKELIMISDEDSRSNIWKTIFNKYVKIVENEHTKS